MKGVIHRLDSTGDSEVAWEGDAQSQEKAKAFFDECVAKGFTMFTAPADGSDGVMLKAFDPTRPEIIATPRMQGG